MSFSRENRLFYSMRRSGKITETSDIMPTAEFLTYLHTQHDALITDSPDYDYYTYSRLLKKEDITCEWLDTLVSGHEYHVYIEDETHLWMVKAYEHRPGAATPVQSQPTGKIRVYQTYNSQYARPDDESSYSAPMPIDTFLPFLKDKFADVTGEGSFDVEINVPLENITHEWLEGLAAGSVTYIVGKIGEDEYDDEIRLRVHTYDIPVQIPTPPTVQTQTVTTPSKIRVYQTYMDDTDRATPMIGKPLAIHKFIEYVKHEYRTALEIMWDDIRVPMEDITREWLEGLAVGSQTELIGSDGEDLWLRVHVYELDTVDPGLETQGRGIDVSLNLREHTHPADAHVGLNYRVNGTLDSEDEDEKEESESKDSSLVGKSQTMKLRLYQTYKTHIERQDHEIGDPMLIDDFIPWVHDEYQSAAIDWEWTDKPVAKADITREWLEGLAVNSCTDLIAEYSEDCCLQVLVTELKVPFC